MPNQETVEPGDLITAELINELIDQLQHLKKLETRVQQLEKEGLLTLAQEIDQWEDWDQEISYDQVKDLHDAGIRNLEELSEADGKKVKGILDGVSQDQAQELKNKARGLLDKLLEYPISS